MDAYCTAFTSDQVYQGRTHGAFSLHGDVQIFSYLTSHPDQVRKYLQYRRSRVDHAYGDTFRLESRRASEALLPIAVASIIAHAPNGDYVSCNRDCRQRPLHAELFLAAATARVAVPL